MHRTTAMFLPLLHTLIACYNPTFPEGIQCTTGGECPSGQICAADNRCYNENEPSTRLAAVEVSNGTLEPAFDPTVTSYTLELRLATESVDIVAHSRSMTATVEVDGAPTSPGVPVIAGPLALGEYLIEIVVSDGTEVATYQITTFRGKRVLETAFAKTSNSELSDYVGSSVAASGETLVVGAMFEQSDSNDIGEGQTDNSAPGAGAAYVFVRDNNSWSQQAYLKPSNTGAGDNFGVAVAIEGDTVVVGATGEKSLATGVNGDQADNGGVGIGAVYVFTRNGTTWRQQAYIKPSNPTTAAHFGAAVDISLDTLVVGAYGENSDSTGVNGNQNELSPDSGAAYVFARNGSGWSQQAYLKASNTGAVDHFGSSVAISGETIAIGTPEEDSSARVVNGDQSNDDAANSGAVYVFSKNGQQWSQQAYLKASNSTANNSFGADVALDGETLAVGAPQESSNSVGVDGDQDNQQANGSGATFVFRRTEASWSQEAYLKASNTDERDDFGRRLALVGTLLVVGAPNEASLSPGVGAAEADNSDVGAGAAYLFGRSESGWSQFAYMKSLNPDGELSGGQLFLIGDRFGESIAISERMIIVGAIGEDSSATGINQTPDNNVVDSGAFYIFE